MPFKKGDPKPPGSGRKKTTTTIKLVVGPTVLARDVVARLEALGCDPIEGLVSIAMDVKADQALRVKAYAELAQYCYPKRRSVDIQPGGGGISDAGDSTTSAKQRLFDRISGIAERIGPARVA